MALHFIQSSFYLIKMSLHQLLSIINYTYYEIKLTMKAVNNDIITKLLNLIVLNIIYYTRHCFITILLYNIHIKNYVEVRVP